jgi:hypothetical protein
MKAKGNQQLTNSNLPNEWQLGQLGQLGTNVFATI